MREPWTLYTLVFISYHTTMTSLCMNFWWLHRSKSLRIINQSSAQTNRQNLSQTLHVAATFSWRIKDRVFFTSVLENNLIRGFDTNSRMHKHSTCGLFLAGLKVYSTWKDCATRYKILFLITLWHSIQSSSEQELL